jgi:hypothetical protein
MVLTYSCWSDAAPVAAGAGAPAEAEAAAEPGVDADEDAPLVHPAQAARTVASAAYQDRRILTTSEASV